MENIEIGDYVYLKEFDLFGMVTARFKRHTWKNNNGRRVKPVASELPFNSRTMYPASDLVYLGDIVSMSKYNNSRQFDILHCQKVTKHFLNAYKGKLIIELLAKLDNVKPDE